MTKSAIDEHADYKIAELGRSRAVRKGQARRRRISEPVAVNMCTMVSSFVGNVRIVRQMADAQNGEAGPDMVEFQAQVSKHEVNEKAWLQKPTRRVKCTVQGRQKFVGDFRAKQRG